MKTIGELVRVLQRDYPEAIAEFTSDQCENSLMEILPEEGIQLIMDSTNLFRVSTAEYAKLMDANYGEYNYCSSKEDVKKNMLLDYIEYKLIDYARYRSINSFKKYQVDRS